MIFIHCVVVFSSIISSIILMKKRSLVIEPKARAKAKAKATKSEERKLLRECCGKMSNGKLRESDSL